MSRILGNRSPFDPYILNHTEPQLDFVMEMYAKDHPDEYEFVRLGEVKPLPTVEVMAQMEKRLIGNANDEFWSRIKPSKAVLERAAQIANAGALLAKAAKG